MKRIEPKDINELQLLINDLAITCKLILKSHLSEGEDLDIVAMTTASLHMMYLLQLDHTYVELLYDQRWNGKSEVLEIIAALEYLSAPAAPIAIQESGHGADWHKVAIMAVSELLQCLLGNPPTFGMYCQLINASIKLLAFDIQGANRVFYRMTDLKTAQFYVFKYSKRLH